jgi:hypothetical protein
VPIAKIVTKRFESTGLITARAWDTSMPADSWHTTWESNGWKVKYSIDVAENHRWNLKWYRLNIFTFHFSPHSDSDSDCHNIPLTWFICNEKSPGSLLPVIAPLEYRPNTKCQLFSGFVVKLTRLWWLLVCSMSNKEKGLDRIWFWDLPGNEAFAHLARRSIQTQWTQHLNTFTFSRARR